MKNFIERLEKLKFEYENTDYRKAHNVAINAAIKLYNELHPSTEIIAPEPKGGSFKVRVTKCSGEFWYRKKIGQVFEVQNYNNTNFNVVEDGKELCELISKSDCEIIPETTVIAFDYKRWKDGDYVRVVTRDGREVTQLTDFYCKDLYVFNGVVKGKKDAWTKNGESFPMLTHPNDLHLEIAKPKSKQVTTYHYIGLNGQVKGVIDEFSVTSIGETITEQQENGEWKIVKTTLK